MIASGKAQRPGFRFAANLKWLFNEMPFLERFEAAALHGFTAVEYASPYDYSYSELRHALKQWNLKQVLINTPVAEAAAMGSNGYACIPGCGDVFREGVDRAIDYAVALDCGLIHLMAGRVPQGCSPSEAHAVFRANLDWAAKRAERRDITFVLECLNQQDVPGYFLTSLDHASGFIREAQPRKVRLLYDFYHAGMSGVNVVNAFQQHVGEVAHIQVADVPGRNEPGSAGLPWPAIAHVIAESGYAGWIGGEYCPRTTTSAGLNWRSELTRAAG